MKPGYLKIETCLQVEITTCFLTFDKINSIFSRLNFIASKILCTY